MGRNKASRLSKGCNQIQDFKVSRSIHSGEIQSKSPTMDGKIAEIERGVEFVSRKGKDEDLFFNRSNDENDRH